MSSPTPVAGPPDSRAATLDSSLSVNETLCRWPVAIRVLNAFGIDSCCGGAVSLRDAAAGVGLAPDELVSVLRYAVAHDGGDV